MKHDEQEYYSIDIRQGGKMLVDGRYKRRVWNMGKMFS
jgi:hypothetical protein